MLPNGASPVDHLWAVNAVLSFQQALSGSSVTFPEQRCKTELTPTPSPPPLLANFWDRLQETTRPSKSAAKVGGTRSHVYG